jgi:hypothetical protein
MTSVPSRKRLVIVAGVSLALAFFAALSLGAALQKSPTADENFHLVAGYCYLKWGDFRVNPEHPPLVKLLAALPLLALDVNDSPLSREHRDEVQVNGKYGWLLANQWLFSSNDAETLFFYARLPMVALAATLGFLIFCWARELYGLTAGFAALVIYVLDPNILAHASIIHTDVPFALTFFGGSYFFWRTLKSMSWFNWLMTGGFFSLSVITKFSFPIILPIWALLGFVALFSPQPLRSPTGTVVTAPARKGAWVGALFFSLLVFAWLTVWAAYEFRFQAVSGQETPLGMAAAVEPSAWLTPAMSANMTWHLVPEAWLTGLVYALSSFNRTAYLLGEISGEGFWWYFPIAFAVKTPLPTLALLLISLMMCLSRSNRRAEEKFLLFPLLIFLGFAVHARINIGLRHIIAVYPFLFVWLGATAASLFESSLNRAKYLAVLLGAWLLASTLSAFPNYLAYFNDLVGSRRAYEILVDSNLDWGQDLKGLKRWMDNNGVHKIQLAYFGTADPVYYGINAVYMPGTWSTVLSKAGNGSRAAADAYIAISATHLVGIYFAPHNPYAKFLDRTPIATIGGSIFVYRTDQF